MNEVRGVVRSSVFPDICSSAIHRTCTRADAEIGSDEADMAGGARLTLVERQAEGQHERAARAPDRERADRRVVAAALVDEAGRLEAGLARALDVESIHLRHSRGTLLSR